MKVQELSTPQEFLAVTSAYQAEDPLRTNHIASVASGAAQGRQYPSALWLAVVDGTSVVGAAVRTAPYSMSLGPMRADAARALAREVASLVRDLPGVMRPVAADEFTLVDSWHRDFLVEAGLPVTPRS